MAETAEKKKRHILLWIVLIAIIALVGYRLYGFISSRVNPSEEEAIPLSVKAGHALFGTVATTTPLTGRIVPADEAAIIPLAAGQVSSVNVEVGDYVSAGQVLFTIDSGQISTQYNSAKAALDTARLALSTAETTYSNMQMLYNEGAVSKADLDSAAVQLSSARTQVVSAEQSLNALSDALGNYSVTTPISGYVTSLSVSVGGVAGQSMAASVADTSSLKIDTAVSEYLAKLVKVGTEVDVYVSSVRSEPFKGVVTNFSPAPALGTLTYPITISIDNSDALLMSGQFAEVKITDEEAEDSVMVPSNAVVITEGRSVVVTLDEEDIPHYADVETGIDNGEYVQILSGIEEGERIVISGQDFVEEGTRVRVVAEE